MMSTGNDKKRKRRRILPARMERSHIIEMLVFIFLMILCAGGVVFELVQLIKVLSEKAMLISTLP